MYETGGGFRAFAPIIASLAFFMFAIGYISSGHWITGIMSIAASAAILIFSFPVFSGRLVRRVFSRWRSDV